MVAVVFHHPDQFGKRYCLANADDESVLQAAATYLEEKLARWPYMESPLPEKKLSPVGTLGFRVNRYGLVLWKQLFNPRQQLALVTFFGAD